MTVVFLNFSNGANPPWSERFFSRAVRVFLPLYFTSTALVRDFFNLFFFFFQIVSQRNCTLGRSNMGHMIEVIIYRQLWKKRSFNMYLRFQLIFTDVWLGKNLWSEKIPFPRSQDLSSLTLKPCNLLPGLTIFLKFLSERPWQRTQILVHSWGPSILDPSAYGFGNARV